MACQNRKNTCGHILSVNDLILFLSMLIKVRKRTVKNAYTAFFAVSFDVTVFSFEPKVMKNSIIKISPKPMAS